MARFVKYRKDLPATPFKILFEFRSGLATLVRREQIKMQHFTAAQNVLWPQWRRVNRDNFDLGILKPRRNEKVIVIARADFRRVCDYKYLDVGIVLQELFMLSMLGVQDAEPVPGRGFKIKCRWEFAARPCFIIEADRIYREQSRSRQ